LARFNLQEFSNLLIEILVDSQRRYNLLQAKFDDHTEDYELQETNNNTNNEDTHNNNAGDDNDNDIYDQVPSDEDYASVASDSSDRPTTNKKKSTPKNKHYVNIDNLSTAYNDSKNIKTNEKRSHSESPLKVATTQASNSQNDQQQLKLYSPQLSSSTTSLSLKSPSKIMLLTSPNQSHNNSSSPSKYHKILNTKFDKLPSNFVHNNDNNNTSNHQRYEMFAPALGNVAVASSLVANAESTLNSIINSLNHFDYPPSNSNTNNIVQSIGVVNSAAKSPTSNKVFKELKNENDLMKSMIERLIEENAQLRAEKMMLNSSTNTTTTSINPIINTTNYITQNVHNHYKTEEMNLYSSVSSLKKNAQIVSSSSTREIDTVPINKLKDNYFIKLENNGNVVPGSGVSSGLNSESYTKKAKKPVDSIKIDER
jgi:hypothetical protein